MHFCASGFFFFFSISTIPDIFLCRLIESYLILFNEVMCHVPRHGCIIFFKNHFPIDRYLGSFHFFISIEKCCNKHSCECLIVCTWEQFSGIGTQKWNCWAQGLSQVLSEATGDWGRCGWVVGSRWLFQVAAWGKLGGSGLCLIVHSRWPWFWTGPGDAAASVRSLSGSSWDRIVRTALWVACEASPKHCLTLSLPPCTVWRLDWLIQTD